MVKRELNVFGDSSGSESESEAPARTFKDKKRLKFIPPPSGESNFSSSKAASKDISRPEATRNIEATKTISSPEDPTKHISPPDAPSKHISPSIDDSKDYMDFQLQEDVTSRHPEDQLGLKYDDLQRVNRETALNTSLFSRPNMSIGLSIMEKMGFKVGDVLGKKQNSEMEKKQNEDRIDNSNLEQTEKNKNLEQLRKPGVNTTIGSEPIDVKFTSGSNWSENGEQSSMIFNKPGILNKSEPINIIVKPDRGGIGATTDISTDLSVSTQEFRNRVGDAKRDDKLSKNLARIQKLCFEMSGEANRYYDGMSIENVDPLWRSYVREYEDKTSKLKNARKRIRVDDTVSSDDVSTSIEGDNESSDITSSHDNKSSDMTSKNIHSSDIYVDLDQQENLLLLLQYLRLVHNFCWFCGERFEDEEDLNANCPGITEELHNL